MAQPFSARKLASSRRSGHVTVSAMPAPTYHRRRDCMHEIFTIGHGIRPLDELVETLGKARVETLVDVRRFPGSRRNPQFNQEPLRAALDEASIAYRHAVELGGRRSGEPGEEQF